jgi:hypothetical protein
MSLTKREAIRTRDFIHACFARGFASPPVRKLADQFVRLGLDLPRALRLAHQVDRTTGVPKFQKMLRDLAPLPANRDKPKKVARGVKKL